MPAKKSTAKKQAAKKPTEKRQTAKKGDLIVIDSTQVGSPTREGEVLEVIQGEVSVRYRIRWADGHETLISPSSGTARIVRATKRS